MAPLPRITEEDPDRGERIADLMARGGWSDQSLAEELGCDRSAPWRWRQGKPISARHVGPLVDALATTREWVVAGPATAPAADDEEIPPSEVARRVEGKGRGQRRGRDVSG